MPWSVICVRRLWHGQEYMYVLRCSCGKCAGTVPTASHLRPNSSCRFSGVPCQLGRPAYVIFLISQYLVIVDLRVSETWAQIRLKKFQKKAWLFMLQTRIFCTNENGPYLFLPQRRIWKRLSDKSFSPCPIWSSDNIIMAFAIIRKRLTERVMMWTKSLPRLFLHNMFSSYFTITNHTPFVASTFPVLVHVGAQSYGVCWEIFW